MSRLNVHAVSRVEYGSKCFGTAHAHAFWMLAVRPAVVILLIVAFTPAGLAKIDNIVVTSAASFQRGMIWGGSIASVFCTGLTGISGVVAADGYPLPLELAGVRVSIGRAWAPLFAVADLGGYQQINLQVPWEAAGSTNITIQQGAEQGSAVEVSVLDPGEFFRLRDGSGAFQHAADYTLVSAANPARVGEVVVGYLTGLVIARTNPPIPTGQPVPANTLVVVDQVLARGVSQPRFQIWVGDPPNQKVVDPVFLGMAPGFVGVYQVNFVVPDGLAAGNQHTRLIENACTMMFGSCVIVRTAAGSLPVEMSVR